MKHLFFVFCVLLLVPLIGLGQEQKGKQETAGQGYLFAAPSAFVCSGCNSSGAIHFGGGGQFNLYKGLGAGADIGYLTSYRNFESGVGLFSLNGLYSFSTDRRAKVVPFVTAGYSMLFRSGHVNGFNFGGGLNYWFSDKIGLRAEFRDHIHPDYTDAHLIQGRIGISFR